MSISMIQQQSNPAILWSLSGIRALQKCGTVALAKNVYLAVVV